MSIRQLLATSACLLLLVGNGCAQREFHLYHGYGIQSSPTVPESGAGRFAKTGYLLEPKDTTVLAVNVLHHHLIIKDADLCELLLLEIPNDSLLRAPVTIPAPHGYYRRWGSTWGNHTLTEVAATGGTISLKRESSDGVRARIHLQFKDRTFDISGFFRSAKPADWVLAEPDSGRERH